MVIRFLILSFVLITFLGNSLGASAQSISEEEADRLELFLKRRLGSRLPAGAAIKVNGFEKAKIKGFKKGDFEITSTGRSGSVTFLLSDDGKYFIMGEPIDLRSFKPGPVKGLKFGAGEVGRQPIPMMLTDDGNYLIVSELVDTTKNPLQDVVDKISVDDVPMKGDKNAKITVVEYSDFQCPFCRRAAELLPKLLEDDNYKGKIRVIYKQFPLPNHSWARPASVASVCAYEQDNDKFWAFHDTLFSKQREINIKNSDAKFAEFATEIGLDKTKFEECLKSPEAKARVEKDFQEAQTVGVNSTPSFFVNGMSVRGADYNGLKSAIDLALSGL